MMKNFKCSNVVVAVLASTLLFAGCQSEEDAVAPVAEDQAVSANAAQELPLPVAESAENLRTTPLMGVNQNRGGCTTELSSIGSSIGLGSEPKLRPVSHGTGDLSGSDECDYFVGFPDNSYSRIVVIYYPGEENSLAIARRIQRLIFNDPIRRLGRTVGGGFGNGVARARRYLSGSRRTDGRMYVVFGNGRTNDPLRFDDVRLQDEASRQGRSVSSLLARYIRLGN